MSQAEFLFWPSFLRYYYIFRVSQPNYANFIGSYCLSRAEIENYARKIRWAFISEGLSIFAEAI
jgi:hypothetical protein